MTRADELDKAANESGYLAILKPRKKLTSSDLTLVSGFTYKVTITEGDVSDLQYVRQSFRSLPSLVEMTLASSSSVSTDEFFYDEDTQELFLNIGVPVSSDVVFGASVKLYYATFGTHYYKDPEDTATSFVYYDGIINKEPFLSQTTENYLFGFIQSSSSPIILNNAAQVLNSIVSDLSFRKAPLFLYHWVGELNQTNLKKIISGVCSDVSFSDATVTINVVDRVDLLSDQRVTDNYLTTEFSNLDPNKESSPIRDVWGRVDGFVPVNLDYEDESPVATTNRKWGVIRKPTDTADIADLSATVQSGSTTTATIVDDASGFTVGDSIWIDKASDEYKIITTIDYGTNTIGHTALSTAAVLNDTVKRSFVGQVQIVKDGVRYFPMFNRDYTTTLDIDTQGVVSGITFRNTMESNVGMPSGDVINPSDDIIFRVYGPDTLPQISAVDFGSADSETNNLTNPAVIIYQLLREIVPESEINTPSFQTVEAAVSAAQGVAYPNQSTDLFTSYKDIIVRILKSSFLRLYIDNEGKWTLSEVGPFGASSFTLEDEDIVENTFSYEFDYSEIYSKIAYNYAIGEKEYVIVPGQRPQISLQTQKTNFTALAVHNSSETFDFESTLFKVTEASTYADRIAFALSDRAGRLTVTAKNKIFDSDLEDIVTVQRTKMPGFAFDKDTERSKDFAIESKQRSLKSVNIELNDQKGIEDNSGSW